MSAFLFGDFHLEALEKERLKEVKAYFNQKDAYIWFDSEIDFYGGIQTMLEENPTPKNNHVFAITTKRQPTNSHDLLFPWDKYENDELFSQDNHSNENFQKLCNLNLNIFQDLFINFIKIIQPKSIRVFVVVGYSPEFSIENFTVEEMIADLKEQVPEKTMLDPVIYEIME